MKRTPRSLEASNVPVVVRDTWGPIKIIPDKETREAWAPIRTRHEDDEPVENEERENSSE